MADLARILEEALALGEEGRWEAMAEMLADALQEAPDDPYLLSWLGVAERELGNDGVAYDYFRRCLAQDPLDPHLLAVAGAGLAAFDDPEAEQALRAATLSAPDLPIARLHYGAYLAREGLYDEALEQLRAAVELDPGDAAVHGELAAALALKGELEEAADAFENALDLAPDDSWTRVLLGLVYAEMDDYEAAAAELTRAALEREDDAEANALAALAAAAIGAAEDAEMTLARARQGAIAREASMLEQVDESVLAGADAARRMLRDTLGPSALRERLTQPL